MRQAVIPRSRLDLQIVVQHGHLQALQAAGRQSLRWSSVFRHAAPQ
jgi:hypothetical protein